MGNREHSPRKGQPRRPSPLHLGQAPRGLRRHRPAHPERSSKELDGATTFSEGVNVGYRWFDKQQITPAFPLRVRPVLHHILFLPGLKTAPATDGGLDVTFAIKTMAAPPATKCPRSTLCAPTQRRRKQPSRARPGSFRPHPHRRRPITNRHHPPTASHSSVLVHRRGQVDQSHRLTQDNGRQLIARLTHRDHRLDSVTAFRSNGSLVR